LYLPPGQKKSGVLGHIFFEDAQDLLWGLLCGWDAVQTEQQKMAMSKAGELMGFKLT